MKIFSIALALGLGLALVVPDRAWAQKIIRITSASGVSAGFARTPVRVVKFGRVAGWRLFGIALPDQTLFAPFYRFPRPYAKGPDMKSRIRGGRTVRQGSPWRGHIKGGRTVEGGAVTRGHIKGGRTVEGGAVTRGHIKGGRTVEGGSRWASHIVPGRTVEGGSRWRGTIPNWRFSGYAAPLRLKGLSDYRAGAARAPWASRLW